jgi:hypothetical protein
MPPYSFIELKSVRHDQRNIFLVRSFSNVPKQGQRALVAAICRLRSKTKVGTDLDGREDPGRLLLTLNDRSDLVGLKLGGPEPVYSLIVEATTAVAGFLQPAIDGIPADACDPGNRRLVQAFDAESRHLIKGSAPMLESIVRSPGVGAKRLLAGLASISTTFPPTGLIEAKTDHVSGPGFSQ